MESDVVQGVAGLVVEAALRPLRGCFEIVWRKRQTGTVRAELWFLRAAFCAVVVHAILWSSRLAETGLEIQGSHLPQVTDPQLLTERE